MLKLQKEKIKKILVVSLTNIGDVILTLPVIDILLRDFPSAKISVIIGPKAATLFSQNPFLDKIYIFNKNQPLLKTIKWVLWLRKQEFDMVIDLRNTAIPFFLNPPYRTSLFSEKVNAHKKEKHLNRLSTLMAVGGNPPDKISIYVGKEDKAYVDTLLGDNNLVSKTICLISPGAASEAKRWGENNFAETVLYLEKNKKLNVAFVGDEHDREIAEKINKLSGIGAVNFCGRTTLLQLAELIKRSSLVLANDSAVMHLASYLDVPILAIFGPTDPFLYGPWGKGGVYLSDKSNCAPCLNRKSKSPHICLDNITVKKVIEALPYK
ncbi:MAG: glycosyltransferase family 9 protein [Candidatus Omnitrophica bacterium]|nr:glycosyltransferase family 9 protein [Candidatus Omnitrophota bacterium]